MTTNITQAHKDAFHALISGCSEGFALFSCFVNGEPTAAIAVVGHEGDDYTVTPLFVGVTPSMVLTDHNGEKTYDIP
jgi:hypothetical protein